MRVGFLLLALVSVAFAAPSDYAIVPIAAVLATSIVAIVYMLSHYLQNSQMEVWAKNEWKELIVAGIIVAIVYSAVSVSMGQIIGATTGYPDTNALLTAVRSEFTQFQTDLSNDYEDVIKVSNRLGMVTSFSYTATGGYIFYLGRVSAPYLGSGGLMQALAVAAGNISTGLMVYEAMLMFLDFFFRISLEAILPVGLALRFIPFTRKPAATLIALGLAGIFLYPISMAFAAEIHNNIGVQHSMITSEDLEALTLKLPRFLSQLCTNDFIRFFTSLSEWGWWLIICLPFCAAWAAPCTYAYAACFWICFQPISGVCWNVLSYQIYNWVQTALQVVSSIALVVASKDIQNAMGTDAGRIYDIVMNNLVIPVNGAASVPLMEAVFVAALTIVGARSLSAALGGEIAIMGLERLV